MHVKREMFTIQATYAINAYHHRSVSSNPVHGEVDTTLCDNVCQ